MDSVSSYSHSIRRSQEINPQNDNIVLPVGGKLYLFGKIVFNNDLGDQKLLIKINKDFKNNDLVATEVTCGKKATLGF